MRRYYANIHAGAVATYRVACVRAGSHLLAADMHETFLSGFRVGATSALAVAQAARSDAAVLGLFGTGLQEFHNCRAICAVRPIRRVQVFSPNPQHRAAFVERLANEPFEIVAVEEPRAVVQGADIVCCATNARVPVLEGAWLEPGQVVVSIANSDVLGTRREVDEAVFTRADEIIINDWDSVTVNRQVELTEPIEKGLVRRENVHTLGDIMAGKARLSGTHDAIVYYKNNTGLAMQFAACGAILHRKLEAEGTNRIIPREWFAAGQYGL
jgi:ornithine cyclodeaminase/alanine dehydrogenase-like protein (mu-crystallin family)